MMFCGESAGRDFSYFLTQRGMFSYTGLSAEQCDRLKERIQCVPGALVVCAWLVEYT